MSWAGNLRAQVEAEFREAQRVRGAIVERDTKPENIPIETANEVEKQETARPRRIVGGRA